MNETLPMTSQKPTALITGATGFVGSHLARRLVLEGWRVHIVSRVDSRLPEVEEFAYVTNHIYDGSTESVVNCVFQAKPDVIFHLASLFLSQHETKDVNSLIESNLLFGNQLLEAMKVNQVTNLVNTGTSWQHYNNDDYNPVCLYAATKQAFEAILEYYVQACDIKVITLKLFDTYGPDDRRPKLFHLLSAVATSGETLNMSGGEQLIDLVHIDDVTDVYLIAAQRLIECRAQQHERYAVSSGNPMPLRDLVELYSEVIGSAINVNWGARPYRFREVMKTWTGGSSLEGWQPKNTLADGMKNAQTRPNKTSSAT
jgi:nucleoside-diphosphate-sugar epimerase